MTKKEPKGTDRSGMKGGDMLAGLKNNSPAGTDGSGMRGGSVNSESTRSGVGPQAPTLGPREA